MAVAGLAQSERFFLVEAPFRCLVRTQQEPEQNQQPRPVAQSTDDESKSSCGLGAHGIEHLRP